MRGGGFQGGRGKRAQKPIPEEGPYRSFVGNLPNDCIQGDFDTLFNGLSVSLILNIYVYCIFNVPDKQHSYDA